MDQATRRRIIAAESQQRAMAWTEPSSDDPRPSSSNPPMSLSVNATAAPRQHGGAVREFAGAGGAMPTSVSSSSQFIHFSNRHSSAPQGGTDAAKHTDSRVVRFPAEGVASSIAMSPETATFFCRQCRHHFTPEGGAGDVDRAPVLLVPCGHTLCRACLKASARGSTGSPSCPACGERFSATAYNRAILGSLGAFLAQASSRDPASEARAAAVADMSPLPPMMRKAIHEAAVDMQSADAAETSTRVALAHQRLASLREGELSVARSEVEDAASSLNSQSTVHDALGVELAQIEAEIRRLEVERQVVVTQLTESLQRRAQGEVRVQDCNRRYRRIAEAVQAHRQCAAVEAHNALQLVPSDAVAAVLRPIQS